MGTDPADAPLRVVAVTFSPGEALDALPGHRCRRRRPARWTSSSPTTGPPTAPRRRRRRATRTCGVLRTGGNVGYGAAANAGLADRRTGWALVANPDIRFEPGAVDELLAVAARWPRAATVGPAIRTPDGQLYPSARDLPSLSTGVGHALLGWVWPGNPWTARYRREREAPRERTGRLAVGVLLPGRPRGVPLRRRLRPRLLHVLRGRRPRRPPRRSGAGCTSTRRPRWSSTRAATRPAASRTGCSGCTTPAPCATCPASYPSRLEAPLRVALRAGLGARMLSTTSAPASVRAPSRSAPPTSCRGAPTRRRWRRAGDVDRRRTPTCATQ